MNKNKNMYFNQRQSAYKMINKCGGVYIQQQFSECDLIMIKWWVYVNAGQGGWGTEDRV